MNLSILSDSQLLTRTSQCAEAERQATAKLITHLYEVNRRKLFSDLKYPSLFHYCVKILKLSEGAASRRIAAMYLSKQFPEIRDKIETGDLNLSTVSRLHSFIVQEEKSNDLSLEKKHHLLAAIEGKSYREAERELLKQASSPEIHTKEITREVSEYQTQITFTVTDKQLALFERVKAKLAHTHPRSNWAELFTAMAEKILEQKPQRNASPTPGLKTERRLHEEIKFRKPGEASFENVGVVIGAQANRIPNRKLKHEILKRDREKCTHCGSHWALQFDHIKPWAKGGETTLENLRILCRNCNQRENFRHFGQRPKTATQR